MNIFQIKYFPNYGRLIKYVLKNICELEVAFLYVRWFSCAECLSMPFGAGTKLWLA